MIDQKEYLFRCPHCGSEISMMLQSLYGQQEYIEDCEVCCNPIQIEYQFENQQLKYFKARKIGQ